MALIRHFVPATDFAKSCAFYEALGFTLKHRDDTLAIFDYEGAGFLLQNFHVEDWAKNCMMQLAVSDLDAWWPAASAVAERLTTWPPRAPAMQPWGIRVGYLADPSGVLWHVTDLPKS